MRAFSQKGQRGVSQHPVVGTAILTDFDEQAIVIRAVCLSVWTETTYCHIITYLTT